MSTQFNTQEPFLNALMEACVNQFFNPPTSGFYDSSGQWIQPTIPPVHKVAAQVFKSHQEELLDAILERLDLDELSQNIANIVIAQLSEKPTGRWVSDRLAQDRQEKIMLKVDEVVAKKLALEALDKYRADLLNKAGAGKGELDG